MAVEQRTSSTTKRSVAEDKAVTGSSIGPSAGIDALSNDPVGNLKDAASGLKDAAVEESRALLQTARATATGLADQRKNDAAQSVSDIAASLRESGRIFEDRPNIQAFVGSAAEGLDQLASGLRDRSFADLYSEVETYARRSPVTVAAVAATAGFLLARFIKASADDLSESNAAERRRKAVGERRNTAGSQPA